ncbi:MAG: ATP-dependent Clp protease adaptor ClpS [Bacteroidetes bacterium]|nr:ATP-dependent Clp protease adaptor ClpS [Bacteroidota bacterium]MDA1333777.1 ATP-dependent Clp protease adaptor ClpS [Bacteroidota bacterium]
MRLSQPEHERTVEVAVAEEEEILTAWRVLLFNDEIHTFDEVIGQIIKATGCGRGKAEDLTWQVHNLGKAQVYEGEFERCLQVESVLAEIGLITRIVG